MPQKIVEFWYEFASTYSYLSAVRIESLAAHSGVTIVWRPFLLGPIFQAQGWTTSPFNIYPAKGLYMVRDITRIANARGLTFRMPDVFPANGLLAARMALCGADDGWIAAFSKAVYEAQFTGGADIANRATLERIVSSLNFDAGLIAEQAATSAIKERLREQSSRAQALGIFGAPAFITSDGELFWGDDRLQQAIDWAAS